MFQARDYQDEGVSSIWRYFMGGGKGNPLLAMPTGTGKSVVIAMFLMSVFWRFPGQRVMVLTHVKELIDQNYKKLLSIWPTAPAGVYSAGLDKRDINKRITFAGIASVAKRWAEFGVMDLLLIDEAHLVSTKDETMYVELIRMLRTVNPSLKVIGFTATAWRLGHGKLHENHPIFTDVCFDVTSPQAFNRFFDEGYLVPPVPKHTEAELDVDGVHMRGGEFIAGELEAHVNQDGKTHAALMETMQLAADRHSWLAFCSGADHAQRAASMLRDVFGVAAEAVYDGMAKDAASIRARYPDMKKGDRDEVILWWKSGRIRALTNNNILTTGIDHPALDCIIMLRPTASAILWVQMLGRGTRPLYVPGFDLNTVHGRLASIAASQKHNCLVLDFARNTKRLGPINDPVVPRRKGEKVGEAPIKLCPSCLTYNHASLRECKFCGTPFPVYGPKLTNTASTDALVKNDTEPVVTVFAVDHITYGKHTKIGKPPSVKVSYYCGVRRFMDFVCFEHMDGFSARKAANWWRDRVPGSSSNGPVPATTDEALKLVEHLKAPTHVRVWVNKKPYPHIMAYCYDGTAFGTQAAGTVPGVAIDHASALPQNDANAVAARKGVGFDDIDDDIPF